MNDTMQWWKHNYHCNSDSKIDRGGAIMGILSATLIMFTVIFYAGSYIQVERKNRQLVQCKCVALIATVWHRSLLNPAIIVVAERVTAIFDPLQSPIGVYLKYLQFLVVCPI